MGSPLKPEGLSSQRVRIVVATSVMLTFISYWRAGRHRIERFGIVGVLRLWHCGTGRGEIRSMVHRCGHAVLFHRPRGVRGELFHVRARWRLPRGQRGLRGNAR